LELFKAVVFDAVGTLIHPEPPAAEVYAAVGRRFGSRLPVQAIRSRFAAAFARQEEVDFASGLRSSEQREIQRWQQIVAEVLADVAKPMACFQELYRHFARCDAWRCTDGTAGLLEGLGQRGVVLGLASNYDGRLRTVVAGLPALAAVQRLIISSEVGWRKPAAEFFTAVCRVVGLPAGRILFVGDDRRNDHDGARAAGLQAALLDPSGRHAGALPGLSSLKDLLKATI
jgi:putative hydrolase of the HAD superfamily